MSDTGNNSADNKPQQDVSLEESHSEVEAVPEVENKPVTPVKRTPSKRLSAVERAQRESEELVKTLGGSLDIEGGRKTRSSTRGTPSRSNVAVTPPPTKRSKATSGTPKRGRGRKLETAAEDDINTSPEKAPSESEINHEENKSPAPVDGEKTQESVEEGKSIEKATETPATVAEDKSSPAKEEDKPEPMEVDSVSKVTEIETEKKDENVQNESESSSKPNEDESEKSKTEVTATLESSKTVEDKIEPPLSTEAAENPILDNENVDNTKANDVKVNSNSLPSEVPPPTATPTPASQVSAAENEHKAESNDLCEPKIASPPITTNNDGATPQYCN